MVITITGLCDRPHGDTCLQLLVSAPPRAAWCTLIMSVCVSEMKCYGLNVCTWMLCLCASVIVFTCACTHQFGSIFIMVSLIHACVCVCVWIHLGVCAYVRVLKCVFGALFLLSIHLQGSHPSICRLPGPPYHLSSSLLHSSHPSLLSHTSLSLSPPYPTSSLSPTHGPILGITIPRCCRRTKNMRAH